MCKDKLPAATLTFSEITPAAVHGANVTFSFLKPALTIPLLLSLSMSHSYTHSVRLCVEQQTVIKSFPLYRMLGQGSQ